MSVILQKPLFGKYEIHSFFHFPWVNISSQQIFKGYCGDDQLIGPYMQGILHLLVIIIEKQKFWAILLEIIYLV